MIYTKKPKKHTLSRSTPLAKCPRKRVKKKVIQSYTPKFAKPPKQNRNNLIKQLDALFSQEVKRKSHGICMKCQKIKPKMGVSHYFPRWKLGTRWEFENCHWSCWQCHTFIKENLEHSKYVGGWYHTYMLKTIGADRLSRLQLKAEGPSYFTTSDLQVLLIAFKKGQF